jgi:mono/diheme cytochrome c family protein
MEELRVLNLVFLRRAALLPYASLVLGVAVLFVLLTAEVSAQTASTGKEDYRHYCAQCHGIDGAGNKLSDIPGADLTHLTKKNEGRFPFQEVYDVVDGRKQNPGHERLPPGMPLWGGYFGTTGVSKGASEAKVKSRISDLVRYIEGLQRN